MEYKAESDPEIGSDDSYLRSDHSFSSDHDSDPEIDNLTSRSSSDSNRDDKMPQLPAAANKPSIYYGKRMVFLEFGSS